MKYIVHVYAVVILKTTEIEAANHAEAIEKADKIVVGQKLDRCLDYIPDNPEPGIQSVYDGEEIVAHLVDEVCDEKYVNSRRYDLVPTEGAKS